VSTVFAGLLLNGCAVNPVSGRQEFMLVSESDEIRLGKATDSEIARTYGLYQDDALQAYLEALGQQLARKSHRPELPFRFKVLDSAVVNAFAVPGGYVYVTRGILAYLNNEAELAGVLGHEIGHVTARHSAQQISRAQIAQLGLGIGSILSDNFAGFAGLAQFGVSALFLKFSRDNERQADDLGVEYAMRSGFDATQMADFFRTLERLRPESDQKGLPSWLSTHPDPPDRIRSIQIKTEQWHSKLGRPPLLVNEVGYLHRIDGLIFGEDPRQGYMEEDIFYHPELKFQFPVPKKWKLRNSPSQVEIVSSDQRAAILLAATREAQPQSAAKKFIQQSQAQVVTVDTAAVNGLPAQRVVSDIATEQGVIRILSMFVQKGELVYVFHGYTARSLFSSYLSEFRRTMEGFAVLTDPGKINKAPDRIRIRTVLKNGILQNALMEMGVPQDKLKDTAILNGKELHDTVIAGGLLKIVTTGNDR
jgi:predicted Zn-dependent protease